MTEPWIDCEHQIENEHHCLTVPDWLYNALTCIPSGRVMFVDEDWGTPIRSFESH